VMRRETWIIRNYIWENNRADSEETREIRAIMRSIITCFLKDKHYVQYSDEERQYLKLILKTYFSDPYLRISPRQRKFMFIMFDRYFDCDLKKELELCPRRVRWFHYFVDYNFHQFDENYRSNRKLRRVFPHPMWRYANIMSRIERMRIMREQTPRKVMRRLELNPHGVENDYLDEDDLYLSGMTKRWWQK